MSNTAVLLVVFNRLESTRKVFEIIRQARPKYLFIAADGPRDDMPGDSIKCMNVRDYVSNNVDWPCELVTKFEKRNKGCGVAVSSAISWFFDSVSEGIILEDDCLPHLDFFRFSSEMLERFRDDERIMLISGMNKQSIWENGDKSYFFSNLGGIWGWASWRRAWKLFDYKMSTYDDNARKKLIHLLGKDLAGKRIAQFDSVINYPADIWDYQWGYARHINSGLAVVPIRNLVQNIGFGDDATHTTCGPESEQKTYGLEFPLKHESIIIPDADYDELFFKSMSKSNYIVNKLKRICVKGSRL